MIILKNENSDFIYLDVVSKYSTTLTSQLSQHPVDGAGVVSDHVTNQNPKISITGFISGADFNFSKPVLSAEDRSFIGIGRLLISTDIAREVEVLNNKPPLSLFPDVVGQAFSESLPEILNINEERNSSYSEKALYAVLKSFYDKKEELTLYEFDLGSVVDDLDRVFIVGLSVNETVESGDSLAFNIDLERVTFSSLMETEIPEDVQQAFKKKVVEEKRIGGETASDTNPSDVYEDVKKYIESGVRSIVSNIRGV